MTLKSQLTEMSACMSAVNWVNKRGIKTAWRDCPRGDWMLWLAGRLDIDRKLLVLAACDCAETALQYVPEGEARPAKAIQTSRNWCNGTATMKDCCKAAAAAYIAAAAAYTAAAYAAAAAYTTAAYAADAAAAAAYTTAAYAADVAAVAAYAADTADVAAYAADAAAYAADTAAYTTAAAAADADTDTAVVAYARMSAHLTCADLVRKRIPVEIISAALTDMRKAA